MIVGTQVVERLAELAKLGAYPQGIDRGLFTPTEHEARRRFAGWARAAGCDLEQDRAGNLFARRRGSRDGRAPIVVGSHLDTVRTGGAYDGAYGVVGAMCALEQLNAGGTQTEHPVEAVAWAGEEGSRFPMAMMGSAVWSGRLPLDTAYGLTDRAGISVRQELERAGIAIGVPLARQPVKASFEVHIEQGPVLEQKAKTIGVVTGVQHMSRHEVVVEGQEAHAGPTPMDMRRDPIRVLADLLPALYAAAAQRGRDARLTFGFIETLPGSPNTVPGRLRFTVDIRHPDALKYASLREEMNRLVHAALERHTLSGGIRCVWEAPGVSFDPACVAAVRSAAAALGYDSLEMVSGAGHDSCNVSAVVPTAMVFVPCAGGLSHNEAESALPGDLEAGANVLLNAMLSLATSATAAIS